MRIYLGELSKIFLKKSIIGIFLALTILNGVLLWVNENQKNIFYTAKQYKALYSDLEGLSAQEAYASLDLRKKSLEVINYLDIGEDVSKALEQYPEIDADEFIEEYKAGGFLKYTGHPFKENMLISDVFYEISLCSGYENYLNRIDENAKRLTNTSLFTRPGTFAYRNIEKTPLDFSHLKGSKLEISPSKGVEEATGFVGTDLIALIMIMIAAITIVSREKELNQIILSRTAFKGRANLGAAKLFTCFFAAFVSLILLYSVNFAVSYFTYGFGDLSRQIQSVSAFNSSNFKISVLEYFLFFLAAKLSVYFLICAVIYLISVISGSAIKVYGILALVLASQTALYYLISPSSYLCLFKYVNLFAYVNTDKLFIYFNLNLFGYPINYITVFLMSVILLSAAFSLLSIIAFSKLGGIRNASKKMPFKNIFSFGGKTVNLFFHECYKIFIVGKALFILIAFASITVLTYTPINEKFSTPDEIFYKRYMLKYEGEYNSEKQSMIDDEEKRFNEIEEKMVSEAMSGADSFYLILKYQSSLAPKEAFEEVKAHAEYLKATDNGEFLYDSGYKLLIGDKTAKNKDLTLALTSVAMVIFCLVHVYSSEYQTKASVLLRTSQKGRGITFFYKFIIGLFIVTAIYFITYFPYFYNVLSAYGTRGIDAPAYSIESLSHHTLSIKEYLIFISIERYIGLIASMIVIYFLSCKLKSVVSSCLASGAFLILPLLLSLLGIKVFDYVLLNPILIGNISVG